jgi:hypothetical protein
MLPDQQVACHSDHNPNSRHSNLIPNGKIPALARCGNRGHPLRKVRNVRTYSASPLHSFQPEVVKHCVDARLTYDFSGHL